MTAAEATRERLEDELVEEFENTVSEGADRLHRTWRALIVTGLFGGIDVGLGIMAMLAVYDTTGSKLLGGAAFGIGLFALRMAHSELFTEEFLVPINAVAAKRGTVLQLLRLWVVMLVTNLAGGWAFMWLAVLAFPQYRSTMLELTEDYFQGGIEAKDVGLALLAGFTITLVTRMSQSSSEGINSIISGFLVVGLGMLHGALNSVIAFGAMHAGAEFTYMQWLLWFCWVIPLNIAGGLLILTLPRMVRMWELIRDARREAADGTPQDEADDAPRDAADGSHRDTADATRPTAEETS